MISYITVNNHLKIMSSQMYLFSNQDKMYRLLDTIYKYGIRLIYDLQKQLSRTYNLRDHQRFI